VVVKRIGTFETLAESIRGPRLVSLDREPPIRWVAEGAE
jgi:hypothetical protein